MKTVEANNERKTVSIVIPVYNNELYIEKCLRSVMTQTYNELEIIVVDDGSKDASGNIIDKLAKEDSRIVVIHQENGGTAKARNTALDIATGTYLTFVDGDDYIEPEYIEKLYIRAGQDNAQMVICGLTYVNPKGDILKQIIPGEYIRFEKEEWTFKISAAAAHFYERQIWEDYHIRFHPGERGEDMPIALFFSAYCERIGLLQEAGYYYVQHEQSAMHNFKGLNTYKLPYIALENMIQKIRKAGVKNSEKFHELFVLRILATFISLAKGADKKGIDKLAEYICRIIDSYYPACHKNSFIHIFSSVELPFVQKVAVWLMVKVKRMHILTPFLRVMCR